MTSETSARHRHARPERRRLILAATLFGLLLAPALASVALGNGVVGLYLVLGTIVVAPVGVALGRPLALVSAIGAALAVAAIMVVGADPWATAASMAILGLGVGLATIRGIESAVAGAAMAAAILSGVGAQPWAPLAILAGGIYGAVVAGMLIHGATPLRTPLEPRRAMPYAVAIALGLGLLTGGTLSLGIPHGYWAPITVLALAAPWPTLSTGRATERVTATLIGAIVAVAISIVVPLPGVLMILALVVGFAGIYYLEMHARRTALLTAAIVLLGGSAGEADVTALARIAMIVAAVAVVIVVAAVLRWTSTGMVVSRAAD